MIKEGIIDPTKVVRVSIVNATSAALNLIKVKCVSVNHSLDSHEDSEIFIKEFV